jgi:hypothetical protein
MSLALSSLLDEKPTLAQVGAAVVVVAGTVVEVVDATVVGGTCASAPADVAWSPPPQPARTRRATTAMADAGREMFRHIVGAPLGCAEVRGATPTSWSPAGVAAVAVPNSLATAGA